jgi:hypothetical protein
MIRAALAFWNTELTTAAPSASFISPRIRSRVSSAKAWNARATVRICVRMYVRAQMYQERVSFAWQALSPALWLVLLGAVAPPRVPRRAWSALWNASSILPHGRPRCFGMSAFEKRLSSSAHEALLGGGLRQCCSGASVSIV